MKEFKLFNEIIEISPQRDNYNIIRNQFDDMAVDVYHEYKKTFKSTYSSIEYLVEKGESLALEYIFEGIDEAVSCLVNNEVYSLDTDTFVSKYYKKYYDFNEALENIADKYYSIVMTEQELDQYRQSRRLNRSRVVGGGFGVGGALKGMATAGTFNAVSGMAHSAVNLTGKVVSTAKASYNKSQLLNAPETVDKLSESLLGCIYGIHFALIDALENETSLQFEIPSSDDQIKCQNIISNLEKYEIEDLKCQELILEAIELDPYNLELYEYSAQRFGDANREIENLARYFNVYIDDYKDSLLSDYFNTLDLSTEEGAIDAKEKFMNQMSYYGVSENEKLDYIVEKINEFDVLARTVGDIVIDNREDVPLAKEEYEKLMDIFKDINSYSEEQLIKIKTELLSAAYKTIVKNQFISQADKRLSEIDLELRTVDKVVFDTRQDAQEGLAEYDLLMVELKDYEQLGYEKLIELKQKIISMNFKTKIYDKYLKILEEYIYYVKSQDEEAEIVLMMEKLDITNEKDINELKEYIMLHMETDTKSIYLSILDSMNEATITHAKKYAKIKKNGIFKYYLPCLILFFMGATTLEMTDYLGGVFMSVMYILLGYKIYIQFKTKKVYMKITNSGKVLEKQLLN